MREKRKVGAGLLGFLETDCVVELGRMPSVAANGVAGVVTCLSFRVSSENEGTRKRNKPGYALGWVAEWSIAAVLKTAVGESPPGVRTPPHPLYALPGTSFDSGLGMVDSDGEMSIFKRL